MTTRRTQGAGRRNASAAAEPNAPAHTHPDGQTDLNALDLRENSLGYTIKRAQVRAYEMLFAILGPDAISPARMTALSIIGAQPGTTQSALAEQLQITRASIVKVIDTLESLHLVERQATPGDRRSHSLVLTKSGHDELRTLHEKTRRYEAAIAANLTPTERHQLMALLDKVALAPERPPRAG